MDRRLNGLGHFLQQCLSLGGGFALPFGLGVGGSLRAHGGPSRTKVGENRVQSVAELLNQNNSSLVDADTYSGCRGLPSFVFPKHIGAKPSKNLLTC